MRALWSGIEGGSATIRFSSKLLGRLTALALIMALAAFVLGMLLFEILLLVHDPIVAVSSWLIVAVVAVILRRTVARRDPPPDRFRGGAGSPAPVPTRPLLVVGDECHPVDEDQIAANGG